MRLCIKLIVLIGVVPAIAATPQKTGQPLSLLQAHLKILDTTVEYQIKRNEIGRLTAGLLARPSNREAG